MKSQAVESLTESEVGLSRTNGTDLELEVLGGFVLAFKEVDADGLELDALLDQAHKHPLRRRVVRAVHLHHHLHLHSRSLTLSLSLLLSSFWTDLVSDSLRCVSRLL